MVPSLQGYRTIQWQRQRSGRGSERVTPAWSDEGLAIGKRAGVAVKSRDLSGRVMDCSSLPNHREIRRECEGLHGLPRCRDQ